MVFKVIWFLSFSSFSLPFFVTVIERSVQSWKDVRGSINDPVMTKTIGLATRRRQ